MYAEKTECIHSTYMYEVGPECAETPVKFFPYSVTSDLLTSGAMPTLLSFCAVLPLVYNAISTGTMCLQQIIAKLCSTEVFDCDKCL